ncbi:hypothetical protein C8R44DRAFT_755262 [Mycena epipterygia]|nr:hypothetical protein C8R44DRAFT_755262 [Mycena epipterygia]
MEVSEASKLRKYVCYFSRLKRLQVKPSRLPLTPESGRVASLTQLNSTQVDLGGKTRRIFSTSQTQVTTPTCTASAKSARSTPAHVGGPGSQGGRRRRFHASPGVLRLPTTKSSAWRAQLAVDHATNRARTCAARSRLYIRGLRPTLSCSSSTCRRGTHVRTTAFNINARPALYDSGRQRATPYHEAGMRSPPARARGLNSTSTAPLLQPSPPDGRASTPDVRFFSAPFIPHESPQSTSSRTTTLAIRTPAARAMCDSCAAWTAPSLRIRSATLHARVRPASPRSAAALVRTYDFTHLRSHSPHKPVHDGDTRRSLRKVFVRRLPVPDTQPQTQRVASSLRAAFLLTYAAQISVRTPSGSAHIPPRAQERDGRGWDEKRNRRRIWNGGRKKNKGKSREYTPSASHPSSTSPSLSTDCPKAADSCADRHGRGSDAVVEYAAVETAEKGEEEDSGEDSED